MGWWKVQGTDNVIGDGPLEALEGAVAEIVAQYSEAFNRKPTKSEWEALLTAVLGSASSEEQVTDDAVIEGVRLKFR